VTNYPWWAALKPAPDSPGHSVGDHVAMPLQTRERSSVVENEDTFLSDREIAEAWGVGYETALAAIHVFEKDPRFPRKDKLLANKRFWPAIKAFMRWRYGLISMDTSILDGTENFTHDAKNPRRSRVILAPKRGGTGSLLGGGSNGR
jgi:hypothetical protein